MQEQSPCWVNRLSGALLFMLFRGDIAHLVEHLA